MSGVKAKLKKLERISRNQARKTILVLRSDDETEAAAIKHHIQENPQDKGYTDIAFMQITPREREL